MREVTDEIRLMLKEHGDAEPVGVTLDAIVREVSSRVDVASMPNLRAAFNLTGTVLHTNLGLDWCATPYLLD